MEKQSEKIQNVYVNFTFKIFNNFCGLLEKQITFTETFIYNEDINLCGLEPQITSDPDICGTFVTIWKKRCHEEAKKKEV